MARQAAVQGAAAESEDVPAQAAEHVVQQQEHATTQFHHHRLFGDAQHDGTTLGRGPVGASAVLVRLRHLTTVFGFEPYLAAREQVLSFLPDGSWRRPRQRRIMAGLTVARPVG